MKSFRSRLSREFLDILRTFRVHEFCAASAGRKQAADFWFGAQSTPAPG
jgi:hypothetical protein